MEKLLGLLEGRKTYIGLALYLAGSWLGPGLPEPDWLPMDTADLLMKAGEGMGGIGLIHKLAKIERKPA